MTEAAALPEAFATSCLNLCIEAGMKSGDTVFIQAGASGLGIAAIQLAKAFEAKVIATVGSDKKAEAVRRLGADIVVNRKTDNLGRILEENPVDIVLDCVGGTGLGKHLEKLAPGGRWILIATLGGESAEIALRPILKRRAPPDRKHSAQPYRRYERAHPCRIGEKGLAGDRIRCNPSADPPHVPH